MSQTDERHKPTAPEETPRAAEPEGVTPGGQERPMTEEEELDEALDETFPASDPISPSRIDGPKIDPGKHL